MIIPPRIVPFWENIWTPLAGNSRGKAQVRRTENCTHVSINRYEQYGRVSSLVPLIDLAQRCILFSETSAAG